jgi:hypothetical protein
VIGIAIQPIQKNASQGCSNHNGSHATHKKDSGDIDSFSHNDLL